MANTQETPFLELSDAATSFFVVYSELDELRAEREESAAPELYDVLIAEKELVLDIVGPKVVGDFQSVTEHVESSDDAQKRQLIEGLRETNLYASGIITDEDIDARLAELPEYLDFSPEVRSFADMFVGTLAVKYAVSDHTSGATAPEETIQAAPEVDRSVPSVTLYKQDGMMVFNDGSHVPLARNLVTGRSTVDDELIIEDYRWRAIKYLHDHRGESLATKTLWEAIDYTDTEFESKNWDIMIGDFLADDLVIDGRPLVLVSKNTPDSRRRYYTFDPLVSLEIDEVDEDSGILQLTNFKMPSGATLKARAGIVCHLLLRAERDSPLTRQMLLDHGLYSLEELDELKLPSQILTGLMTNVRAALGKNGDDKNLRIYSDKRVLRDGDGPEMVYWMRRIEKVEDTVELGVSHYDFHIATRFLEIRQALLKKYELPELPEELENGQNGYDRSNSDAKSGLEATRRILELFEDEKTAEKIFDLPSGSPRMVLADYLHGATSDKINAERFRQAIEAPLREIVQDTRAGRVRRLEFETESFGLISASIKGLQTRELIDIDQVQEKTPEEATLEALTEEGSRLSVVDVFHLSNDEVQNLLKLLADEQHAIDNDAWQIVNKLTEVLEFLIPEIRKQGIDINGRPNRRKISRMFNNEVARIFAEDPRSSVEPTRRTGGSSRSVRKKTT